MNFEGLSILVPPGRQLLRLTERVKLSCPGDGADFYTDRLAVYNEHAAELQALTDWPLFHGVGALYKICLFSAWKEFTELGQKLTGEARDAETAKERRIREAEYHADRKRYLAEFDFVLGSRATTWTMADFRTDHYPGFPGVKRLAETYVERVVDGGWANRTPKRVLSIGSRNTGVGKTHLACAVVRRLIERAPDTAQFVRMDEYLSLVREASQFGNHDRVIKAQIRLQRIEEAQYLVMDELSIVSGKGPDIDRLIQLFELRFRTSRWTVVTGQVAKLEQMALPRDNDEQAQDAGRRLRSRLAAESATVAIPDQAPDMRRAA